MTISFSPYDYRMHEDPYPTYARLREEEPLHHNEQLGFWALSRHADVAAAFKNHERFSSANGVSLDPSAWGSHAYRVMSFLALDPPRHTRLRALVSKGFTPRRILALEPHIRELTRRHLNPALEKVDFDFVEEVAGRVPMDVICELLGVPEEDRPELRRLADVVVHREEGVFDVPQEGKEASLTLVQYYADLLAERRRCPVDDLSSALINAELDGDRLEEREIIAFMFLMVVAGNETTTKLLANALYWAWRHPDQLTLAYDGRIEAWVNETLRYDASSQALARTVAADDVEYHGRKVPAGERLILLIGAANRDPRAFPNADRYDLTRDTSQMISFGGGRHYCLGANLARLEARVVLEELVSGVRSYEVDESGARRVHSVNVRGFARLPISVEAR